MVLRIDVRKKTKQKRNVTKTQTEQRLVYKRKKIMVVKCSNNINKNNLVKCLKDIILVIAFSPSVAYGKKIPNLSTLCCKIDMQKYLKIYTKRR